MLSCAIDLRIAPQTTRYRSSSGRRVVETVTEGAVRKPRQRESYFAGCRASRGDALGVGGRVRRRRLAAPVREGTA